MDRKIVLTLVCCLAAACSSSASRPSAATYLPGPGADAVDIAKHLPGCGGPKAGNPAGGAPDMTSTASCTLSGHLVIVDSFTSAAAITDLPAMSRGREMYYAHGGGWLAFLADQGATADTTTMQEQLTNNAADLLRESSHGDPYPPASLAAQRTVTSLIARQLRGTVGHVS